MSASAQNVDIDSLLDLSEYDGFNSPSTSPAMSTKPTFPACIPAAVTTPSMSTTQTLSGPSHDYDMYRQQTGLVPGAIATAMAVNESNNTGYQAFGSLSYLTGLPSDHNVFDFNSPLSRIDMAPSEIMDLESEADPQLFPTVNPGSIEQEPLAASPALSSQAGSVGGRLWPGAHSQAALAKAQAQAQQRQQQHRQQQQHYQQQQQQQQQQAPRQILQPKSRSKAPQPTDPIVEQKIAQLLNTMRAKPSMSDSEPPTPMNLPRLKKEEEEMDEDERLLASEEGKKLTSKERRQLRNKVSARAFRYRRKEYISQLEAEVASKVTENSDLRSQNRALLEENKRLSDLTRMLLSSPSFSNFLDHLSGNSVPATQPVQIKTEMQAAADQQHMPTNRSSFGHQVSQQQIGAARIPEQTMDYSNTAVGNGFNFQPRVFVVEAPEMPTPIQLEALSGKTSNFVEETFVSDDDKVKALIERPVEVETSSSDSVVEEEVALDEDFESDPEFALFHSQPEVDEDSSEPLKTDEGLFDSNFFAGIETGKIRMELLDASEEGEAASITAMARVQAISASIEDVVSRLELYTMDWRE